MTAFFGSEVKYFDVLMKLSTKTPAGRISAAGVLFLISSL